MEKSQEIKEQRKKLLSAIDLQRDYQFGRTFAYQLLHREDMPVVVFGTKRYMIADQFDRWLAEHALNA